MREDVTRLSSNTTVNNEEKITKKKNYLNKDA